MMVSVKTQTPVAKESMFDVMSALRKISVSAPINIGEVVHEICGCKIVTTKGVQ